MNRILLLVILLSAQELAFGQSPADSLLNLKADSPQDTNMVKQLIESAYVYLFNNPDTALVISQNALALARSLYYAKGECRALNALGEAFHFIGDYPKALEMQFEALRINRQMKDPAAEAESLANIGVVYIELGQYRQALRYLLPGYRISQHLSLSSKETVSFLSSNIGAAYDHLNLTDSAMYFQRKAYEYFSVISFPQLRSFILRNMGLTYANIGRRDSAIIFYKMAISNSRSLDDMLNLSKTEIDLAELYKSLRQNDSSLYFARHAYIVAQSITNRLEIFKASKILSNLYMETQNKDSALFYLNIAFAMSDGLYGPEKIRQLQVLMLEEQQRQQTLQLQNERFRNKIKYIALVSALGVFLLFVLVLVRNNRTKQKANTLLARQKDKIEETLTELVSTQSQLVQREKMASLGELTAGIAHEIQNPLNFVNNFSEVNSELLAEQKEELEKGNTEGAKIIANEIAENEKKIVHHGKRADAIVKGMLQHSRGSTGVKEPTDINTLVDEHLRLAYHALRAKDKNFNPKMESNLDTSIGMIDLVPQDIGRVMLNLINNAFYAVSERGKQSGDDYTPTVSVSTKRIDGKVLISVKDNAYGIPDSMREKIFQPFFTTKPTGQGTGLGLSISYDIVKAHGGELKTVTEAGEGTSFTIVLPS